MDINFSNLTNEELSINFSNRLDVVSKVQKMYNDKILKRLELFGSYKSEDRADLIMDILNIAELNYRVTKEQVNHLILCDPTYISLMNYKISKGSIGLYDRERDILFIYPSSLLNRMNVDFIYSHEFAHMLDERHYITNQGFIKDVDNYLRMRNKTMDDLIGKNVSTYATQNYRELFAESYTQLILGLRNQVVDNIISFAIRRSNLDIKFNELKTNSLAQSIRRRAYKFRIS
jgi:hypothetical protein